MSHTGPSMGSQNEDLDVLITRIQGFLEERGYESPIIRQLRVREMDQEAREKELTKRERALEIREQALAEMEARRLGSSLRYVCDYCHVKICGRGTSCARHKHHSCNCCHGLWKAGKPKGSGRGEPISKLAPDFEQMD